MLATTSSKSKKCVLSKYNSAGLVLDEWLKDVWLNDGTQLKATRIGRVMKANMILPCAPYT